MKICIGDWRENGKLFEKNDLPYAQGQEIDGTIEDAMKIVNECLTKGLNVMVSRTFEGLGTKKSPSIHTGWLVAVDTFRFQQR